MILSLSPVRLPLRTLPSEATARKKKVAMEEQVSSKLLRHPHHLIHRTHAIADLSPAVLPQVAHAVAPRGARQDRGVFVRHDQFADLVVEIHHLENAHPRDVSAAVTLRAARAAIRWHHLTL